MKKITLMLLLAMGLNAAQFNWVYSYKEGAAIAAKENKPMLVYMHRPGCESCDFLESKVFNDENLSAYTNEHFVPVLLNVSKSDAPKHLIVKMSPSFHFVNAKGAFIEETWYGGRNAKSFLKMLQDVEVKFLNNKPKSN